MEFAAFIFWGGLRFAVLNGVTERVGRKRTRRVKIYSPHSKECPFSHHPFGHTIKHRKTNTRKKKK